MAFLITAPDLSGLPPIGAVLSGKTVASGTTRPLVPLGTICRAVDPTFGEGEFIYLPGVASTAVGSVVVYNTSNYTTTLCPVTANLAQPIAIATAANTSASTHAWYQIGGVATVAKSVGVTIPVNVALGIRSTAKIGASASGKEIQGARSANSASTNSAATTLAVLINRPHMQGRVT